MEQSKIAENFEFIQMTFNLSDEQFLQVMKTTHEVIEQCRETNIINNAALKKRYIDLYLTAQDWRQQGYPILYHIHNQLSPRGENILNLLCNDPLNRNLVMYLGRCIVRELAENNPND